MVEQEMYTEDKPSSSKTKLDKKHGLIKKSKPDEEDFTEYSEVMTAGQTGGGGNDLSVHDLTGRPGKNGKSMSAMNKYIINFLLIAIYIIIWCYILRNVKCAKWDSTVFQNITDRIYLLFLTTSAFILVLVTSFVLMIDYHRLLFVVHSEVYSYCLVQLFVKYIAPLIKGVEWVEKINGMLSHVLLFYMSILLLFPVIFIILYLMFLSTVKSTAIILMYINFYRFRDVLFYCFLNIFISFFDVILFFTIAELKEASNTIDYIFLAILGIIHLVLVKCIIIVSTIEVLKRRNGDIKDTRYKEVGNIDQSFKGNVSSDTKESINESFGIQKTGLLFYQVIRSIFCNLSSIIVSCVFYFLGVFKFLPFGLNTKIIKFFDRFFCYNVTFTLIISVYDNTITSTLLSTKTQESITFYRPMSHMDSVFPLWSF
ncbi:putative transporter [Trachipleistophora hominis]|uniref:Putative transporter n=1 Tax=Trachipleistophora hominis TaxID=72359 RepID=L7JT86_TRAHO|nr:putative transporter [Trachipleistophora hominis]